MYVGRIDITYHFTGTWELLEDSLGMKMDSVQNIEVDHSHIKIKSGKEKEVEDYIKDIKENLKQYQVKMRKKEKVQNKYGATINPSGNKIELALGVEDESGSKRQGVSYLQKSH